MVDNQKLHKEVVEAQQSESFDSFLYFEKRLHQVLKAHLNISAPTHLLRTDEKQMIFSLLWYINSPQRMLGKGISRKELKELGEKYQQILKTFRLSYKGKPIGLLDYNILAAFCDVLSHGIKNKKRLGMLKQIFAVTDSESVPLLKNVPDLYEACFAMLLSRLNDVRKKHYAFEMKRTDDQYHLNMTLTPNVSVYRVRQESMMIQRSLRSVCKLSISKCFAGFHDLKVSSRKFGDFYKGKQKELNVYIQTDALSQLSDKLDVFDSSALNYILNSNFRKLETFEIYNRILLIPIQVYKVRVGYFVCDIVEDKLVIRSFRFLTQANTPEGDRFLSEFRRFEDNIRHCIIDRMSLLFKVKDEVCLGNENDFEDLRNLKNFNLNIDAMQEANYEEFLTYIKQGEESEMSSINHRQEELSLQNQPLGSLLKLLLLNSFGLIAALITKMFYVLAHKLRRLAKPRVELIYSEEESQTGHHSSGELHINKGHEILSVEEDLFEEQVS